MKFFFVAAAITVMIMASSHYNHKTRGLQNAAGFAVVELFTSEGCSSCPPADEAVIDMAGKYKRDVYFIGFHVDYWNYLGWNDAFSNSAYSQRQQHYGGLFGLNSVYTPQIIINGKKQFVGSDKNQLEQSIEQELKTNKSEAIELRAQTNDAKTVNIFYKVPAVPGSANILNIAIVQSHAHTDVRKGENEGKELNHINIVRGFKSVLPTGTEAELVLPLEDVLTAKDCMVIAYLQDKSNWHILGAAETRILEK